MKSKKLIAVKRERPLFCSYLDNERKNEYVSSLNRAIFFYRYFMTKIEVLRGEVFKIRFDQAFGSELRGHHFAVAMQASSDRNQTLTIIPLTSVKEAKRYNPKSTVNLGEVEGIPGNKESIALVNQMRTVDKMRLFGDKALDSFVDKICDKIEEIDGEFIIQDKDVYRLTKEQFDKILHSVNNYLFTGSVERR